MTPRDHRFSRWQIEFEFGSQGFPLRVHIATIVSGALLSPEENFGPEIFSKISVALLFCLAKVKGLPPNELAVSNFHYQRICSRCPQFPRTPSTTQVLVTSASGGFFGLLHCS
jgi:hypothetical protein